MAEGAGEPSYVQLLPGDPAPYWVQACSGNPRYMAHTAAGRWIVMGFFATAGDAIGRRAVDAIALRRNLFDDERFAFFGVSLDPADAAEARVVDAVPGIRFVQDHDASVSRAYGCAPSESSGSARLQARRLWMVLGPTFRVEAVFPFQADGSEIPALFAHLETLPPPEFAVGFEAPAPVLVLPRVFEPELCRALIAAYDADDRALSGFMREEKGRTVVTHDPEHKRRRDHMLVDEELKTATRARIHRRLSPEIARVHQFTVTRLERYLVSCYSAEDAGHFRRHRDNTTKGTAHRRFAVSINLNGDFEGGDLRFPEYGRRLYRPPPGGAVVFSCSLFHEVEPVRVGRRYAFLPFLFDEAAEAVRQENLEFVSL